MALSANDDDRPRSKRRGYAADYMRKYRAERGGNAAGGRDLPFAGVDGEGGGENGEKHPGYHAYFLLRAGGHVIVPSSGNVRLTTRECLGLLADLPPTHTYVAFFFDYDVTKILEDLPHAKLEQLMDRSKRGVMSNGKPAPVWYQDFQVDYLPRKEFKVRRVVTTEVEGRKKYQFTKWVVINDVGSFFQCKFVEALEKWGIGEPWQLERIRKGKDMRGNFHIQDVEEIAEYNAMECVLLAQLMTKFREACHKADLYPSRWQGPGLLAKAMMKRHGVPRSKDVPLFHDERYTSLIEYAKNAYYGGRPELMAIGPVDRTVYQYDINSAYPYAMLSAPCLMHGGWRFVEKPEKDFVYRLPRFHRAALVYGSFTRTNCNSGRYPMWFGLPVRAKEGAIYYPGDGRGWYWDFEIRSAKHQVFVAESAWVYTSRCDCKPLGFVEDTYQKRLAMGKDHAGIPFKLALNSLYGICAQSVGSPEYANPIWASYFTAVCRTAIQDLIHSSRFCRQEDMWCGKDILMVATDSVATFQRRTDIKIGEKLGEWGEEIHERGMFLIQPGLYYGSNGKRAKTRGVPLSVVEAMEDDFRQAFDRMVASGKFEDGDVSVPQRMFVGIRYALHRRNLKLLGQWIEFRDPETGKTGKTIRFDWTSKRAEHPVINPLPGVHSYIETFPKRGSVTTETVPYSKDIGGLILASTLRDMYSDQPDWVGQIEPGELG